MIRAVCFNRKSFDPKNIERICLQTGCQYRGVLTDTAMTNCIESFPDGSIYLSYIRQVGKHICNCRNDLSKFIQLNRSFGKKRN